MDAKAHAAFSESARSVSEGLSLVNKTSACVDGLSSSLMIPWFFTTKKVFFFFAFCLFCSHFPFYQPLLLPSTTRADPRACTYDLRYFPIHGLGATSRAILSISGVEWIDNVQPFATWREVKASTPFGFLPILTVRDPEGKTVNEFPEADVIERYLAKKLGFFGSTAEEELEVEILLNQTITLHNIWIFRVVPAKDQVRDEVTQAFLQYSLQFWINNCEKHLKTKAGKEGGVWNGHFVGDKRSIADIKAAVLMDTLLAIPGSEESLNAENAPGLWKVKEKVDLVPAYAAYRRSDAFKHHDHLQKEKVVPKFEGYDMKRCHIFS